MLASFLISNSVRGTVDGIKNLAKYSSSTNAELSSLMNSLNLLKNSLASAFSPVLSAIAPALDTLINYCVNAINAIGQLFAALTGHQEVIRQMERDHVSEDMERETFYE